MHFDPRNDRIQHASEKVEVRSVADGSVIALWPIDARRLVGTGSHEYASEQADARAQSALAALDPEGLRALCQAVGCQYPDNVAPDEMLRELTTQIETGRLRFSGNSWVVGEAQPKNVA